MFDKYNELNVDVFVTVDSAKVTKAITAALKKDDAPLRYV